jgi:hypothetical protein
VHWNGRGGRQRLCRDVVRGFATTTIGKGEVQGLGRFGYKAMMLYMEMMNFNVERKGFADKKGMFTG